MSITRYGITDGTNGRPIISGCVRADLAGIAGQMPPLRTSLVEIMVTAARYAQETSARARRIGRWRKPVYALLQPMALSAILRKEAGGRHAYGRGCHGGMGQVWQYHIPGLTPQWS